jgi:DNA-binding beta-propeller fold protein YncE
MWPSKGWAARNALGRYWNALVRGVSDEELAPMAAALDAEALTIIDRLRNRQRYRPDPAFVSRLERDLMQEIVLAGVAELPPDSASARAGNGLFPSWTVQAPQPLVPPQRRWQLAALPTALLVLLVLVVVVLVVVPHRGTPEIVPVIAPEATPATPAVATPATDPSAATPFWRTVPPPRVGAEFVWAVTGPASTGTPFSSQIAVDPDGNLWVMDGGNGRFQIFGPDGAALGTWGSAGTGEGAFDFQRDSGEAQGGIAFTPLHADADFYVADSQNARIQQFSSDRAFVRAWGARGTGDGEFLEPVSVTVSYDGLVYVVDDQRNDVQVFTADGAFVRIFGGPGHGKGQFERPLAGAFNQHGYFWVVDTGNDRLQQFQCCDPARDRFKSAIGDRGAADGQFDDPRGLVSDRTLNLYVADRGNHRVQVFAGDGRFANLIDGAAAHGSPFHNPAGVAIGAADDLFVLDDDGTTVTVQKFRLLLP